MLLVHVLNNKMITEDREYDTRNGGNLICHGYAVTDEVPSTEQRLAGGRHWFGRRVLVLLGTDESHDDRQSKHPGDDRQVDRDGHVETHPLPRKRREPAGLQERRHADVQQDDSHPVAESPELVLDHAVDVEERPQSENRAHVAHPCHQRVTGDHQHNRDRVEREQHIDQLDDHEDHEELGRNQSTRLGREELGAVQLLADPATSLEELDDPVLLGVETVVPLANLVGRVGQISTKGEHQNQAGVNQAEASDDKAGPEDDRAVDAP